MLNILNKYIFRYTNKFWEWAVGLNPILYQFILIPIFFSCFILAAKFNMAFMFIYFLIVATKIIANNKH